MPLFLFNRQLVVIDILQRSFGAVLQNNEDPLLFLRVDGFTEEDDVWVLESEEEVDLRIDHLDKLLLLEEVFLFDLFEPQDLYCLHSVTRT
jgi:hypothetical protein